MSLGVGTYPLTYIPATGNIKVWIDSQDQEFYWTGPCLFAALPTPANAGNGATAIITDCPTNPSGNFYATVTVGAGTYTTPLICDGTNWRIG